MLSTEQKSLIVELIDSIFPAGVEGSEIANKFINHFGLDSTEELWNIRCELTDDMTAEQE
jgi:hypothetical protein